MKKINLPNKNIDLQFDEDRHKYFRDGREVPGVTKISGIMDETGWMIPWAAKMAGLKAEEILLDVATSKTEIDEVNYKELALQIKNAHKSTSGGAIAFGHAGHGILETFINWKLGRGPKPTPPKNEALRDAVRPFIDWSAEHNPDYISAEEVVYYEGEFAGMKFDYAGTLDLRFNLDGVHAIGDFKTAARNRRGYLWQMALYAAAVEQSFGKRVDKLFLFKLPKDGHKFKVRDVVLDDRHRQLAPALAAARSMNYEIDGLIK